MYNEIPFVNRRAEIKIVHDAISQTSTDKKKAIIFWGKGGNGKTALFRKIKADFLDNKAEFKNIHFASMNFDNSPITTTARILVRLRKELENEKIDFSIFDYAMLLHWSKNIKDEAPPTLKNSIFFEYTPQAADDFGADIINTSFEKLTKEILDGIIQDMPFSKLIVGSVRKTIFDKKKINRLRGLENEMKIFFKSDGKTLQDDEEFPRIMLHSFILDLNRHQNKKNKKYFFLFDQVEYLFDKEGDRSVIFNNEYQSLIKKIASEINHSLTVLFVREQNMLGRDSFWTDEEKVQHIEINGLKYAHATEALQKAGYINHDLIERMLNYCLDSKSISEEKIVYPELLKQIHAFKFTSPDIFDEIFKSSAPKAFVEIDLELTKRLLKNINMPIQHFLKHVHALDGFYIDFWLSRKTQNAIGVMPEQVNAAIELNILNIRDENLYIDPIIKRGFQAYFNPQEYEGINQAIIIALDKHLTELVSDKLDERYLQTVARANQFRIGSPIEEYILWLENKTDPLFKTGHLHDAQSLWLQAIKQLNENNENTKILYAKCLSELGTCSRRLGQLSEAFELFQNAYNLLDYGFIVDHTSAQIANNFGEFLQKINEFEKAKNVLNNGNQFEPDFSIEEQETKKTLMHNFSEALRETGDYELAEQVIEELFDELGYKIGDKDPMLAASYNSLGVIMCKKSNYKNAEFYFKRSLECWSGKFREHVIGSAITYTNLGDLLNLQEKFKLSLIQYTNAVKQLDKYYNFSHIRKAILLLKKSQVEAKLKLKNCVDTANSAKFIFDQCEDWTVDSQKIFIENLQDIERLSETYMLDK